MMLNLTLGFSAHYSNKGLNTDSIFTKIISFLCVGALIFPARSALAQRVTADQTLPNPSIVTATEDSVTGNSFVITGGTIADRNLFHSFREFSVPSNSRASFQGVDARITNIFSRVTGIAPSRINGAIEVRRANGAISAANVFLLNPNGILFGPNASLNIGGSFFATTGDRIQFADSTRFSAIPSQSSPLLTVTTPIGIQFGANPGAIVNQSGVISGTSVTGGLRVSAGRTLGFIGGDVLFRGGVAIAPAGRIEIGSVGEFEGVSLRATATGWRAGYSNTQNFRDIRLTNQSLISGLAGSAIALQGRQIAIAGDSRVLTATNSQIGALAQLHATESLTLDRSLFSSRTLGDGDASSLQVITPRLTLHNRAAITSQTFGAGRSGDVQVRASQVDIQGGASIGTSTLDAGQGGNVSIRADASIQLSDRPLSQDASGRTLQESPTQIFTEAAATATHSARAGQLTLVTPQLMIRNGAQINASTFGAADAGQLTVRANAIELVGVRLAADGEPFFDRDGFTQGSGLFAQANRSPANVPSSGNGGRLAVYAQRLVIRDGAGIATNTFGAGNAGNIQIQAADSIQISGVARRGDRAIPSGLYSTSGGSQRLSATYADATGRGGTIRINTPELRVLEGGYLGVDSSSSLPNSPGAGQLIVQAPNIELEGGNLNAETEIGNLASIDLRDVDVLTLGNGSRITTSAGLLTGSGTGGNITINANFILALPAENSDITANAYSGSGGRVEITAQRLFGIDPLSRDALQAQLGFTQPQQLNPANLPSNDITAISQLNPQLNGQLIFNLPEVDPSQGIIELPTTTVDASRLIARGCTSTTPVATRSQSEFLITGRSGLSPSPDGVLTEGRTLTSWISVPSEANTLASPNSLDLPSRSQPAPQIVEAQGWIRDSDGKVSLVVEAPNAAALTFRALPNNCS